MVSNKNNSIERYDSIINELTVHLAAEAEAHRKTKIKLKMREHENHAITQSRSYKLTRIISRSAHLVRVGRDKVVSANPKRLKMLTLNKWHVTKAYKHDAFRQAFTMEATADLAVVLHLYYADMLPAFLERLKVLQAIPYDLYITIPEQKLNRLEKVKALAPTARIAIVPNCGRDVLPFVQLAQHIANKGYSKILKLHTKKSPHRTDGEEWRDKIVNQLLPVDPQLLQQIIQTLDSADTALIGPETEYVSMLVNMSATTGHVRKIVKRVCGMDKMNYLMRHPDEFGFYGGTMFWARLDALVPTIKNIEIEDFEPEMGQEDSTLAHALERLLNVIPELNGKKIYSVSKTAVTKRDYETTAIPSWAEYSID